MAISIGTVTSIGKAKSWGVTTDDRQTMVRLSILHITLLLITAITKAVMSIRVPLLLLLLILRF